VLTLLQNKKHDGGSAHSASKATSLRLCVATIVYWKIVLVKIRNKLKKIYYTTINVQMLLLSLHISLHLKESRHGNSFHNILVRNMFCVAKKSEQRKDPKSDVTDQFALIRILSYTYYMSRPSPPPDFIVLVIFGERSNCETPHYAVFSVPCHFFCLRSLVPSSHIP
jgi:hypothetical protein